MLRRSDLHAYQVKAIEYAKVKLKCALFLDLGLGKTTITLTAISDLLDDFAVERVLIVAPLRVANTVWKSEARLWDHLKHLDIVICTGSASERRAALAKKADITVINRENVAWLVLNGKWRWDMVVIDESSSFKSSKSKRFRALKKVSKKIKAIFLLSGTPAPNGQMDLWPQMFLIDQGDRLFKTITQFRQRFFVPAGFQGYSWEIKDDAADDINKRISDVCIHMDNDDYLNLPSRTDIIAQVTLCDIDMEAYREFEKHFIIELEKADVTAVSAGVLANKLLQFANGNLYDEDGDAHPIHDLKIKALEEIIEDNPTENLLVAYNYKSDLARLQKAFPKAVTLSRSGAELDAWNDGEVSMLLAHPASAGHGLNAQHGGSVVVWFGLNWSLELYQQFNARLHRQGQTRPVRVLHIVAEDTIDERVMLALAGKAKTQRELLEYIK